MSSIIVSTSAEGPAPSNPQKPARVYACSRCPKTFKRSEHCTRHERGHTQEKPFHCRFCARQYARKDLVNRHEKSFHPRADIILDPPIEQEVEVTGEDRRLPSPPSLFPPNISSAGNPNTASAALPESEIESSSHASAQRIGPGHRNSVSITILSPPRSDLTATDGGLNSQNAENQDLRVPSSSTAVASQDENALVVANESLRPNSATSLDRSTEGGVRTVNSPITMPDLSEWHATNMSWTDNDQFTGAEFSMSTPSLPQPLSLPQGGPDEAYSQRIDLLSMMPEAGINFEADFSTYLFHSGYSPSEQQDAPTRLSLRGSDGLRPISIEARAVPFYGNEYGTFSRMPSVMAEKPRKLRVPMVNLEAYNHFLADAKNRLCPEEFEEMKMLSNGDMQRFLTSYFTCFHRHCPIIHISSLDLKTLPSHLVLAMCAIGALYRLSRKMAKDLWNWADQMVGKTKPVRSVELLSQDFTAAVQCRMLLGMFAIFSGDMTERALARTGYWCTEYRVRRSALSAMSYSPETMTWSQWLLRETSKRLLYGIFIMSSLMTVTYDLCPAFSVTQDLDLEILDDECLWEASTSQQWEDLMKSRNPHPSTTVRDAMNHLIFGKESHSDTHATQLTAFATTMVFHAVNVHMWSVMQCTQSFTAFAVDDQNSKVLKAAFVLQVDTALARCYALLTADRSEREYTSDDPEGPLLFNCLALLRSAYVRVFTGAGSFNRMILLSEEPVQVAHSIQAYVAGPQERSPFLTKAVDKAYGGLLTPIKAGYLLVQKTAALTWSVEHAVAAWDCALFVTKWIHSMELQQQDLPPDEAEMRNLVNFRELLSEVDSQYTGNGSLAGEVARIWASFLDDTWVWGITPLMGQVLRQLSKAFEKDWADKFPEGNPAGPISR